MVINGEVFVWVFIVIVTISLPVVVFLTLLGEAKVKQLWGSYIRGPLLSEADAPSDDKSILNRLSRTVAVVCALGGILSNLPVMFYFGLVAWLPCLIFTPSHRSVMDVLVFALMHASVVASVLGISVWLSETDIELMVASQVWLGLGVVIITALVIKHWLGHFQNNPSVES